jgi:hypothetical protein
MCRIEGDRIAPASAYLPLVYISMETSYLLRHQIISSRTAQLNENVAEAAIGLWEPLATQIILIVGEGGFNSIYARSVSKSQSTFPWLVDGPMSPLNDHRFAALKMSLEGQPPKQASAAIDLLLTTFTDILASLIGEDLTKHLLRSAWGVDATDISWQETKDEP